jgi:hypothetical protein
MAEFVELKNDEEEVSDHIIHDIYIILSHNGSK